MCRSTESAARVAERLARQLRAVLGSVPSTHTKAGFGVASAWEGAWQWLVCSGWCARSGAAEDIKEYYVRHLGRNANGRGCMCVCDRHRVRVEGACAASQRPGRSSRSPLAK